MPDVGYSLTRREGHPATVVVTGATVTTPETGEREMATTTYNLQCVAKAHMTYSRLLAAQAAQRDVGDTQFVIWTGDVPFTRLKTEDYIIQSGDKYQVVTSELFGTAIVVTARHVQGSAPVQKVSLDVSNAMGLGDSAEPSVS